METLSSHHESCDQQPDVLLVNPMQPSGLPYPDNVLMALKSNSRPLPDLQKFEDMLKLFSAHAYRKTHISFVFIAL